VGSLIYWTPRAGEGRTFAAQLRVDRTIATAVFAPLLSVTGATTSAGGRLKIEFTASGGQVGVAPQPIVSVRFRVLVDGVVQPLTSASETAPIVGGAMFFASAALQCVVTPPTTGVHTVAIEWSLVAAAPPGTWGILPVTRPTTDAAALIVKELGTQ